MKHHMAFRLLAILLFNFLLVPAAVAQSDTGSGSPLPAHSITVTGMGQASGTPDIAYLQIGTDQANSDPAAAFNDANAVINSVRDAVEGLGVKASDIQTSTFNMWVQENTDSSGNPTGERTYHAQHIVTITVRDVSKTGDVVSAAVDAGANNINGLSFGIADPAKLANQARDMAIADAQARAQQIATTLGISVGSVLTVNKSVSSDGQPLPMMAAALSAGSAAVSQGQLTISVQVTIAFAIAS